MLSVFFSADQALSAPGAGSFEVVPVRVELVFIKVLSVSVLVDL